ncbi:vWA domain-containing protein [Schumannella soli]|uniref:VWA domain-containing protein n=1 Tax=Schumannella soli TaxID=2590779 RepID=A0A506Y2Y8_9MICO|nr:vWA domain-containing protein [Schumannella soli]TPW76283.1 VWA domain-containing protein [Schumannella soli]
MSRAPRPERGNRSRVGRRGTQPGPLPTSLLPAWDSAQALWGVHLHPAQAHPDAGERSFAWFSFPPQVTVDPALAQRDGIDAEWESVFAHEIGHHVLAPSTRIVDLKIVQQMARALVASSFEPPAQLRDRANWLANVWCDLLINVRVAELQRRRDARQAAADPVADPAAGASVEPGIVRLWRILAPSSGRSHVFWVMLRAYELIWDLPDGSYVAAEPPPTPPRAAPLTPAPARAATVPERFREQQAKLDAATAEAERARAELLALTRTHPEPDARLLARTVRTFGDDPIRGALRAGMILAPYLLEGDQGDQGDPGDPGDHRGQGGGLAGSAICGGQVGGADPTEAELGEVLRDARLREEPRHPALDDDGRAVSTADDPTSTGSDSQAYGLAQTLELYDPAIADAVLRAWYLDGARRWVKPIREPAQPISTGAQIPGPTELWDVDDELSAVDWRATLAASPRIVPGVTTRRRTWLEDDPPTRQESVDLDLWVDSSGSMPSPAADSPALLAGAILIESVLAGGGRVQVTSFSGPRQVAGLARPTRNRSEALGALLHYFGGGTTFPLDVLAERYRTLPSARDRRRHLVVLSDGGLESLFGQGQPGLEHVAGDVRQRIDTATLIVIGWLGRVPELAEANGYAVEHVQRHADAPAACRRLAEQIARAGQPSRRGRARV